MLIVTKLAWELDMIGIKRLLCLLALLTTLGFILPLSAAETDAEAGKTLLTKGAVTSDRVTGRVTLKRRSLIFEKDEIRVGNDGRAQFRMSDTAIISLQENSILQIKEYKYKEGSKTNSALLELIQGGLRTITGAIGKNNKKAYELRTPLATIGIRGTDYEVEIVTNGMYVAVWDGVIRIKSRIKNGCDLLLGKSQSFMFVFIDRLGKCKGLDQVPNVFSQGHSSNIKKPSSPLKREYAIGNSLLGRPTLIEPIAQLTPTEIATNTPNNSADPIAPTIPLIPTDPIVPVTPIDPTGPVNPTDPVASGDFNAFTINQASPSLETNARASELLTSTPTFVVGVNDLHELNNSVSDYQQSVGGYPVSWGYWGEFSSTLSARNITNSTSSGLIWATYEATDPDIVSARTGSFSRYDTINDSLVSGTQGVVSNLSVQMDVNFDTGSVTNGALSANTPNETWVAVFDGQIQSGDLDLQLNGASVIDSDPNTPSPPRDADGFIAGDFVGQNAEAILGAFGLSESADPSNHIEGVFILEER